MPDNSLTTRIDEAAPAVTRQERVVAAAPREVFDLLADVAAWPAWQPKVSRTTVGGPLQIGSTFRWKAGVSITSTVTEFEPGRVIAWTGRAIGTRAIHTWSLVPIEGGTLVRTEESMSGWLPRLMTRMMQRTLDQGVAGVLDDLQVAVK